MKEATLHAEIPRWYVIQVLTGAEAECLQRLRELGMNAIVPTRILPEYARGTWSNGADYYFLLYFSAGEEVADGKLDIAPRATVPLYISETNNGVAIGQYSTATTSDAKFESRWHGYFYAGLTANAITNIQGGVTDAITVASNGYTDVKITFPKAYASAPLVMVCANTDSTAYYIGQTIAAVLTDSVTATGFTARVFNDRSSSVSLRLQWLGYGGM